MLIVNGQDISEVAVNLKYQDVWNNGAGTFTFEYPTYKTSMYPNGSIVIFQYGAANMFYGFLFKTDQDHKKYKCTCYDQRRYFKSSNSILRPVGTLKDFLNTVALSCGDRIRLGTVDDTQVKLGKYLFDNKTHLDMVYQSIQDNLVANGYWYALRDNFGALDLRDIVDLRLPLIIGDNSLGTDFDYTKSIDDDTFNYIKVAKDDADKGVRYTYIAQDSTNMAKWGKLMYYDKISAGLNDAQLIAQSKRLLQLKNRETQTLKLDCIGDTRVLGGSGIRVVIAEAGLDIWAVANSVTHQFTKNKHTMSVELKFVW
jgi:hypothetical protein